MGHSLITNISRHKQGSNEQKTEKKQIFQYLKRHNTATQYPVARFTERVREAMLQQRSPATLMTVSILNKKSIKLFTINYG